MKQLVARVLGAVDRVLTAGARMSRVVVGALRLVLALVFAGVLLAQVFLFPMVASDLAQSYPEAAFLRAPLLVMVIVGLAMVQVAVVCIGRLLVVVAESSVFTRDAYRFVDGIVLAGAVATTLAIAALVVQFASGMSQPGILLVTMGAVVAGAGVTLLVVVLRALLVRAVALDEETDALQRELGAVI